VFTAKPRQLIWRRFSRHTLAVVSLWFLVLLEVAPTKLLFAKPLHPYTEALMAAVPALRKVADGRQVRCHHAEELSLTGVMA